MATPRRVSGTLAALALTALPAAAGAQSAWASTPWVGYGYRPSFPLPPGFETRAQTLPLGPGLAAEKVFACSTSAYATRQCVPLGWRPRGFTFGARADLARALTFSGDGRGRIIASTERDVIVSDDRGQSWQTASWNGVNRPQIIAMDADTRSGVAVAEGAIHVSDDAGASWRYVRELPSRRIVQVVVAGRNAVLADGAGGVWALVGGAELTVLSESGPHAFLAGLPQFSVAGGAIEARDAQGHALRLDRGGLVDRDAASSRWER